MDHYVKIYRYPKSFVQPIIDHEEKHEKEKGFDPFFEEVLEKEFEKGIVQAASNQQLNNYCIGVINVSKIETISYEKQVVTEEFCCPFQTADTNMYHVVGSYINTSNDVDFSIRIDSFSTSPSGGNIGDAQPRNLLAFSQFPTEDKQEHIMGVLVNGITKAMQRTYDSTTQGVVDYYPPFDLGSSSDMVSQTNPFQQGGSELPPDFEKELLGLEKAVEIVPHEPPGHMEG